MPTVAAEAAITLPMDSTPSLPLDANLRRPQVVVIAADEKDGVICSRAGDHPAEENKGRLETARPKWETRARTVCAINRETPIVINGSNMVTGFR